MKILFPLLGAAIAWAQQPPPAPPPPADPVVLTVGAETITKSEFESLLANLPEKQRALAQTAAGRRQLAEQLAGLKTLAQAARAQKLDQTEKVKLQIDNLLANLVYQELGNSAKPDDAAMQAYYAAHKQDWDEVKARHILIRMKGSKVPLKPNEKDLTPEEALAKTQELRAKIVAGADFATVAKAESDDAGTAQNGGELGEFTKDRMLPEFSQAAFAQEVGKLSEPVKTSVGYHLILVEAHTTKPFDGVRAEIEKKVAPEIQQKAAQQGLDDLKKKTDIVYNETYFGK